MPTLEGRVAIVTGGTNGIGRGIARKLAASGVAVAVNGRPAATGEALVHEIAEAGGLTYS